MQHSRLYGAARMNNELNAFAARYSSPHEGRRGRYQVRTDRRTSLLLRKREGLPVLPLQLLELLVHCGLLDGTERRPLRLHVRKWDRAGCRCYVGRARASVRGVGRGRCESATHEAECRGVHEACRVVELVRKGERTGKSSGARQSRPPWEHSTFFGAIREIRKLCTRFSRSRFYFC
jgi:hypothetical protein